MWWIVLTAAAAAIAGVYSQQSWCPQKPRKKHGKHRILCIGDSITFGAGVIWTRFRNSYPAVLGRLLGKNFQVLNYGIPGATAQKETDCPYEAAFLKAAQETDPKICILMLGTNDSKPHNWDSRKYEAALESWVEQISHFPAKPKIILLAPTAVFSVDGEPVVYGIQDAVLKCEILPIVKSVSEKYSTGFIDLYHNTSSHPEWFADGVHPNLCGNREIASFIYKLLFNWRNKNGFSKGFSVGRGHGLGPDRGRLGRGRQSPVHLGRGPQG